MLKEQTLSVEEKKQDYYFKPQINYIPANLNLDELIYNKRLYGFDKFKKDQLVDLISTLYTLPVYNKDFRELIEKEKNPYLPLYSKIMYHKNKNYLSHIELLLELGIWERDNSYSTESHSSKSYRFTENYASQPFQKYYNYHSGKKVIVDAPVSTYIVNSYSMSATAKRLVDNMDEVNLNYNDSIKALNIQFETNKISTASYNSTGISLEKIHDRDFFAKQDEYGRLHTNYTNLKSEYRGYLTAKDGSDLVSIDIKNSQPFFSTLLLNSQFWEGDTGGKILTVDNIKPKPRDIIQQSNIINTLIMFTKSVEDKEDVIKYIDYVLKGVLYEFLVNKFRTAGVRCANRKKAKDYVFKIFFSDPFHLEASKYGYVFQSIFPNVYKLFSIIKKEQYNVLAILLQSIESEIVIEEAVKGFYDNAGDFAITIHDSIAVEIVKGPVMEEIMLESIERNVGYKPTLKCDILKPKLLN